MTELRPRLRVAAWIALSVVSFVLAATLGTPALANYLAPLVPPRIERSLGAVIDADIRELLSNEDDEGEASSFACGMRSGEAPGQAALSTGW